MNRRFVRGGGAGLYREEKRKEGKGWDERRELYRYFGGFVLYEYFETL